MFFLEQAAVLPIDKPGPLFYNGEKTKGARHASLKPVD